MDNLGTEVNVGERVYDPNTDRYPSVIPWWNDAK